MAAYTAKRAGALRKQGGSLLEKIVKENIAIEEGIDIAQRLWICLTPNRGTLTALETSGVDIADGATTTYYAVALAPPDSGAKFGRLRVLFNEAYVKDTTDAKIEVIDNYAAGARTVYTYTAPAAGAAENFIATVQPDEDDFYPSLRLDLKVTATGSDSGTGHVSVWLEVLLR